ncbi:hypothetical protein CYPRO_2497 [Cyclonatronum proteinivorum]|uniref:Soluble ligand binding domain-containing protein n=1 Tax=Cyclonatronum proteinivorum TaxID=1457365 RepID=A0A345UMN7_9BACT|nr:hypothetical protein [Cyclonatronum proteinivorum]AXJ01739.1 hypothetical protein CYPRO_2497 [Cyclonatronum proteinivorum]
MKHVTLILTPFRTALILSLSLFLFFAQQADAQTMGRQGSSLTQLYSVSEQMPNHFRFVRTGEPSITVVVIGSVVRPGTYEVREGTDMNELMLYTGGPAAIGARTRRITPDVNFFLSRTMEGEGRRIIFETTFEAYTTEFVDFPVMQDFDVVIVETDPVPTQLWREILSLTSQILSIIASIAVIVWRFRRF